MSIAGFHRIIFLIKIAISCLKKKDAVPFLAGCRPATLL